MIQCDVTRPGLPQKLTNKTLFILGWTPQRGLRIQWLHGRIKHNSSEILRSDVCKNAATMNLSFNTSQHNIVAAGCQSWHQEAMLSPDARVIRTIPCHHDNTMSSGRILSASVSQEWSWCRCQSPTSHLMSDARGSDKRETRNPDSLGLYFAANLFVFLLLLSFCPGQCLRWGWVRSSFSDPGRPPLPRMWRE